MFRRDRFLILISSCLTFVQTAVGLCDFFLFYPLQRRKNKFGLVWFGIQRKGVGKTEFNKINAVIRRYLKRLKKKHWAGFGSFASSQTPQFLIFKAISSLSGNSPDRSPRAFLCLRQGTDHPEMANRFVKLVTSTGNDKQQQWALCSPDLKFSSTDVHLASQG